MLSFDNVYTVTAFGKQVDYGVCGPASKIIFIFKTGNNGTVSGYKDKYLKIATNIAQKYGVTAIIATNPENEEDNYAQIKIDTDIQFIKNYANKNNISDYKIYYVGFSNSAATAITYMNEYEEIARILALNTLPEFNDDIIDLINKFRGEKLLFVHGTEDIFFKKVKMLCASVSNQDVVRFIPYPKADHRFEGMLDEFIHVNELIFDDKI